jgi:hypothetical protein
MQIAILKEYKSIRIVPPFELPDFCVLTLRTVRKKIICLTALERRQ